MYISVGDIDKDNSLDILFTGARKLGAVTMNGIMKQGFPVSYSLVDGILSDPYGLPSVGDLDNETNFEISVSIGGGFTPVGDLPRFYAYNQNGTIANGFPKGLNETMLAMGTPIADLDDDEDNEIVVGPLWNGDIFVWSLPQSTGQGGEDEWNEFYYDSSHSGCYKCNSLITITIETERTDYLVGEDVDLTDPPAGLQGEPVATPLARGGGVVFLEELDKQASEKRRSELLATGEQVTKSGTIEVLHSDDFENKQSQTRYFLKDDETAKRYQLFFEEEPVLVSGAKLTISGKASGEEIAVLSFEAQESQSQRTLASVLGEQRTAVVLVNFDDDPVEPWSVSQVNDFMFGANSANTRIREYSYDNASLSGDVLGWFTLPAESRCDFSWILDSVLSIEDPRLYFPNFSRLVIFAPDDYCQTDSDGTIGSWEIDTPYGLADISIAVIYGFAGSDSIGVVVHELGHSFGLWHANYFDCINSVVGDLGVTCFSTEYGDLFDSMGNRSRTDRIHGHFNAAHKEALAWLGAENILETNQRGTYSIKPLEIGGTGVKALKIPLANGRNYYVEYRRPVGDDAFLGSEYTLGGAMIHYDLFAANGDTQLLDNSPNQATDYDADVVVRPGEAFFDARNNITLEVASMTSDNLVVRLVAPAQKSQIKNLQNFAVSGNLTMKVQKLVDGNWQDYSVVVSQSPQVVPANGVLGLDTIWNPLGWTPTKAGQYRAFAEFDTGSDTFSAFGNTFIVTGCSLGHTDNGNGTCTASFLSHVYQRGIERKYQPSWALAHDAPDGTVTVGSWADTRSQITGTPSYTVSRTFIPFDTNSVPEDTAIVSAVFSFYPEQITRTDTDTVDYLGIVKSSQANNQTVSSDDFDQCGAITDPQVGGSMTLQQMTQDTVNSITLNETGNRFINPSGWTQLCLRTGNDIENLSPASGEDRIVLISNENTQATQKPKLEITYAKQ